MKKKQHLTVILLNGFFAFAFSHTYAQPQSCDCTKPSEPRSHAEMLCLRNECGYEIDFAKKATLPQNDMAKLNQAVMSVLGREHLENLNDAAIEHFLTQKIRHLPASRQTVIRNHSQKDELFALYWYFANGLIQSLSALPKLNDPNAEKLRQQWLRDARQTDVDFGKVSAESGVYQSGKDFDELIQQMSQVFEQHGLRNID